MLDLVLLVLPYTKLQAYLNKMTIPFLPMNNKYTVLQPKGNGTGYKRNKNGKINAFRCYISIMLDIFLKDFH